MKLFLSCVLLFVAIWFTCAIFDFNSPDNVFRAYQAKDRISYSREDGLPRLLPYNPSSYRIRDRSVALAVAGTVKTFQNCTIFDRNNWSCSYSSGYGTFGVRRGVYFEKNGLKPLEILSRFEYILLKCRWDMIDDGIKCLFRPFTT